MKKILLLLCLIACGAPVRDDPAPVTPPPPAQKDPPAPGGDKALTFNSDVKPLLNSYCAECHSDATFIATEQAFLSSKAPTRIANKSMPQKQSKNYAKWGDAQRAVIAAFVQQQQ